ncbi:MAG: hypothetical protein AAF488_18330, partial [Planctomycetota bacterium]
DHPFFNWPNGLTEADWSGWVQERGLYFLALDPAATGAPGGYRDLVTMEDPWPFNPGRKGGALVTRKVGDGRWTYVGLGLFRQLPAGIPGAHRLLVNVISAK